MSNPQYSWRDFFEKLAHAHKFEHVIPDFKSVFCTESKIHTYFTQSDQVNGISAH